MVELIGEEVYRFEKSRPTIVVADNDADSLANVTAALKAEGMSVQGAERGDLALASIAAYRPDLVLLSARLPVLDGFEICRRMKMSEKTRDIPVVFLGTAEGQVCAEGFKFFFNRR